MNSIFYFMSVSAFKQREKEYPFVVVNTDHISGLYLKRLEKKLNQFPTLKQKGSSKIDLSSVEFTDVLIFGDGTNYDLKIEKIDNLTTLDRKNVKVFDLTEDFESVLRAVEIYCKKNGIKQVKNTKNDVDVRININVVTEHPKPNKVTCPLMDALFCDRPVKKTLVNVYEKPDLTVEKITVHHTWVKIGWNQYDIYIDGQNREFITLEDGEKLFIVTDRYGRRYLKA